MKTVFILDGDFYARKSYHAFLKFSVGDRKTGLCFGFINSLSRLIKHNPHDLIVTWGDMRENLWRREIFPDYKKHRDETPVDFIEQCEELKGLLSALGVCQMEFNREEADDIIAHLCNSYPKDWKIHIYSNDHDMLQLIEQDRIVVVREKRQGEVEVFNDASVLQNYEVTVKELLLLFAMTGDKGDDIEGLERIGPKTAAKIINGTKDLPGTNPLERMKVVKTIERNILLIELPSSRSKIDIDENQLELVPEPNLKYVDTIRHQNAYGENWKTSALKVSQFMDLWRQGK